MKAAKILLYTYSYSFRDRHDYAGDVHTFDASIDDQARQVLLCVRSLRDAMQRRREIGKQKQRGPGGYGENAPIHTRLLRTLHGSK